MKSSVVRSITDSLPPLAERFNADYFERGRTLGLSWYENYRWMPERSHAEVRSFAAAMGAERGDRITDYGCAKGFFVRAAFECGFYARGIDISRYALSCAGPPWRRELYHINDVCRLAPTEFGFCKDTLEHCTPRALAAALDRMARLARRWLVIVPLGEGGRYRIPEYELDRTHMLREPEQYWFAALEVAGLRVNEMRHRVEGLKDHWAYNARGNLFLFATSEIVGGASPTLRGMKKSNG